MPATTPLTALDYCDAVGATSIMRGFIDRHFPDAGTKTLTEWDEAVRLAVHGANSVGTAPLADYGTPLADHPGPDSITTTPAPSRRPRPNRSTQQAPAAAPSEPAQPTGTGDAA